MDPKIIERMKRIEELTAKIRSGKFTPEEKAEMERLLKEQMDWAKKNPAASMEAMRTMELLKKTPEEMKAEYEAAQAKAAAAGVRFDPTASTALREEGVKAGLDESVLPKPVTPPSKLTREQEQARTDYGKAVRERAVAEGKSVAVADAMALEAYNSWYPEMKDSGVMPEAAPDPSVEYPMAETPAPKPAIPAPEPKPAAPVVPEVDGRGYGDKTREFEEVMDAARDEPYMAPEAAKEEAKAIAEEKKPGWKDKIKDLGTKYGVPMLEILEAVGKQRGGIDKPTALDRKYQEKLDKAQKEYMENLEKQREEREAAQYEKRTAAERAWQEQQAIANRAADVAARKEELSSREKLLQMQLAAQKGAAATGGVSIIPQ